MKQPFRLSRAGFDFRLFALDNTPGHSVGCGRGGDTYLWWIMAERLFSAFPDPENCPAILSQLRNAI